MVGSGSSAGSSSAPCPRGTERQRPPRADDLDEAYHDQATLRYGRSLPAGGGAACGDDGGGSRRSVSFETVFLGSAAVQTARQQTIRDGDEWAQVWRELHADVMPIPPLPAVDFGQEMVVLVTVGMRPNACYRIEITSIVRDDGRLHGAVADIGPFEPDPEAGCTCAQVITYPAHAVRLARTDEVVEFDVVRRNLSCG